MGDESSLDLLALARGGDQDALNRLLARYLPRLRGWATGRLPAWARGNDETDDLVQKALIRTLRNLGSFEPRHEGALQAYLREAVLNQIRDAMRAAGRRPVAPLVDEEMTGHELSPFEQAVGAETVARYDAALAALRPQEREAIIGRIELGYDYGELAESLGKPSEGAARVAVHRALLRLAEEMQRGRRR